MRSSWVAVLVFCGALLIAPKVSAAEVQLNGLITDTARKPIPGAEAIAIPGQQRYWLPDEMRPLARGKADAEGKFYLSVPTTGPVVLIGWSKDHRMAKFPVNPDVAANRTIGMALEPGFTVSGKVIDAATGDPIKGALVGPLAAGLDTQTQRALRVLPQWTATGLGGEFKLEGLATDIDHTFLVRSPGTVIANVELSQGQEDIKVKLDKGSSTVSGEIFARGEPQTAFANVLVRANGNGFDVVTRTDAQSRFRFEGLPGGTFSVEPIMLSGNRSAKVEVVEMPDDNNTSIALEVSAGYQVSGTAIDLETSAPATGVSIGLADHWTSSSTDGNFRLGPFFEAQAISLQVPEETGWQLAELITGNEYDTADGFNDVTNIVAKVRRQRLLDVTLANFELTTAPVIITVLDAKGAATRLKATSSTVSVPLYQAGSYAVYASAGSMASEAKWVSVGLEKSVPVSLAMQAGADVSGKLVVTNTTETTRVQTLRLALLTTNGQVPGPPLFLGTSPRKDGTFQLSGMPTGEFLLTVENRSASHQTTRAVTLVPGANDLGEIQWQAGNRLAGEVRSASDLPIPYTQIALLLPGGEVLRTQADEEGKFLFDDIYADTLTGLIAEAGSYALYREQNVPLPLEQKIIIMQALGKLNVTVDAPAGSVWDVHVVRMNRWASGTYADQLISTSVFTREAMGGEALEIGLGEKGWFRAVALEKSTSEIRVSPAFEWAGEAAEGKAITLASTANGRINGTVSGATVPVEVTVINTAIPEQLGHDKAEKTVGVSSGRFDVTDLPPGNYMVLGQGETYSGYVLNVELAPGQTAAANLAAVEPATAEGVVQLAGEPLPQATVKLVSETDSTVAPQSATTDATGQFAFPGLLPDTYSITATYQSETGELTTRKSLAIKLDSPPAAVTLDLTPPQPVQFTIDPAVGITADSDINLMNKETRQLTKARWVDGALEAEVAPGEYEIWLGDAVGGVAVVADDGTGHIKKQ